MEINQFNPLGYQVKTDSGKTYTKSNICKYALTAGTACLYLPKIRKSNVGKFLVLDLYEALHKSFPKLGEGWKHPINIIDGIFNITFGFAVGKWLDDKISDKRAQKLDTQS